MKAKRNYSSSKSRPGRRKLKYSARANAKFGRPGSALKRNVELLAKSYTDLLNVAEKLEPSSDAGVNIIGPNVKRIARTYVGAAGIDKQQFGNNEAIRILYPKIKRVSRTYRVPVAVLVRQIQKLSGINLVCNSLPGGSTTIIRPPRRK